MHHTEMLNKCVDILKLRAQSYGNEDTLFDIAAQLASLMSGNNYSKYDITLVMEAVKLARRRFNPLEDDNYLDMINYSAFSAQFAKEAFVPRFEDETKTPLFSDGKPAYSVPVPTQTTE